MKIAKNYLSSHSLQNQNKALLIKGPGLKSDIFDNIPDIIECYIFNENFPDPSNNPNKVDYSKINNYDSNNLIIYAHGETNSEGLHMIRGERLDKLEYTHNYLAKIQSYTPLNKPLNIEILSCQGGAAINAIDFLNEGSTLITSTSYKNCCSAFKKKELIDKTYMFTGNPFVKFISNMLVNHDDNSFAINLGNYNNSTFISSCEDNIKYSDEELECWKINELNKFKIFLSELTNINAQLIKNQKEKAEELIDNKIKFNSLLDKIFNPIEYRKQMLLESHLKENYLDIIEKLLVSGVNINNTKNHLGDTILILTSSFGLFDAVKYLLDHKANPNILNNNGSSALSYASELGFTEIVKILLEHNENPNALNNEGTSSLIFAVQGNYIEIVKLLLKAGANPNILNNNGLSALEIASYKCNVEMTAELLHYNAIPYFNRNKYTNVEHLECNDTSFEELLDSFDQLFSEGINLLGE